jgi:hypothetical protein
MCASATSLPLVLFRIADLTVRPLETILPEVDPLLVGRQQEIEDVVDLIGACGRVVTITGGFGTGKSALAVAVAQTLSDESPSTDGRSTATTAPFVAVHVDLLGCRSVDSVFRRTVNVFGVHFRYDERRFLYNWINARDQRLLVVFDNLDDVVVFGTEAEVGRLSDLVDEMATRIRNVRILCAGGRKQFYRGIGVGSEVYRLGDLRASTSHELLGGLLPDLHTDGVAQIAEACGNVSLALRVAAAALSPDVGVVRDSGDLFELLTSSSPASGSWWSEGVETCIEKLADGDEFQLRRLRQVANCLLKVIATLGDPSLTLLRRVSCFASCFDRRSAVAVFPECGGDVEIKSALDRLMSVGLLLPVGVDQSELRVDDAACSGSQRYRLPILVRLLAAAMSSPTEAGQASALYRAEVLRRLSAAAAQYHDGSDGFSRACAAVEEDYDNIVDVLWKTIDREDAYEELSYLATVEGASFASEHLPDDLFVAVFEAIEREAEAGGGAANGGVGGRANGTAEGPVEDRVLVKSRALASLSYRHSLAGRPTEAVQCGERAVDLVRPPPPMSAVTRKIASDDDGVEAVKPASVATLATALYCLSRAQWAAGERRKSLATGKRAFEAWKGDRSTATTPVTTAPVPRTSALAASSSTEVISALPSIAAVYACDWYAWTLTQSDNFQTARHW